MNIKRFPSYAVVLYIYIYILNFLYISFFNDSQDALPHDGPIIRLFRHYFILCSFLNIDYNSKYSFTTVIVFWIIIDPYNVGID